MRASTIARRAAPVKTWTLANGQQIPKIGFGTWKLNKEQAHTSVSHALKTGFRHIDSAWAYKNEDATGEAIRKSGVARKDLFITSKLWNTFHGDKVEAGLDTTLKDLGVDYLDLYLMHWPVAFSNPNTSQISSLRSSGGYPVEEVGLSQDLALTWRKMEEMVQKGKVRSIGISNFNIRRTEDLLNASTDTNPVVNQVEVNLGVPNDELLLYSEAHQIMLQAYSPLGAHTYREKYLEDPVIQEIAERNNMTPAQVQLAWPLARGIVPITRSSNPAHIEENFAAASKELPWEDVIHLTQEAQARPIDRSMDPSETWATNEDIFEDYKDQTMLNSLKDTTFEAPPAHQSDGSHYLEPRNDPEAPQIGPGGTAVREMHTMTSRLAGSSRRPTVVQQLGQSKPRFFSTSSSSRAVAEAAPPTAEEVPTVGQSVLLRNTAKTATQTPGIRWTDGEEGIERQARKMNMYTVRRDSREQFQQQQQQRQRAFSTHSPKRASVITTPSSPMIAPPPSVSLSKLPTQRKFPARKTFLMDLYRQLLADSKVVLILQHNSVGVREMSRIRADLAAVPMSESGDASSSNASPVRLTVARSGILRKAVNYTESPSMRRSSHMLFGPIAMLTFDHLSPTYISRVLAVMDKALGAARAQPKPVGKPHAKAATNVNPRFLPLMAYVESGERGAKRVVDVAGLRDIGLLPSLDQLRAQIVGLLSATPSRLVSTLNQARGGHLALTLDAHRRQLDGDESDTSKD